LKHAEGAWIQVQDVLCVQRKSHQSCTAKETGEIEGAGSG
jgi:hypothetical protein